MRHSIPTPCTCQIPTKPCYQSSLVLPRQVSLMRNLVLLVFWSIFPAWKDVYLLKTMLTMCKNWIPLIWSQLACFNGMKSTPNSRAQALVPMVNMILALENTSTFQWKWAISLWSTIFSPSLTRTPRDLFLHLLLHPWRTWITFQSRPSTSSL